MTRVIRIQATNALRRLNAKCLGDWYGPAIWFGVFRGWRLVAYAGLDVDAGYVEFVACGVDPAFRGRGYQRALIQARLRYARRYLPGRPIRTHTSDDNKHSQSNLRACGFKPIKAYGEGYTWWHHDT